MLVGIDWATEEHAVCVLDETSMTVVDRFDITHSRDGFTTLTTRLARQGTPAELHVGIERPDGRLVDWLLECGHPVVPVKTNAIKAWREAETMSGAKTDAGDAEVIADYLAARLGRLRVLRPFSEQTRALRALVRSRTDLVDQRVAAINQLNASLDAFWPGAKALFRDIWSPIALAFLTRYPTPHSARRLGPGRMIAFLAKNSYSGRQDPAELIRRLRAAPEGIPDGPESDARRDQVLAMVTVIEALNTSIRNLDQSIIECLDEHPDAEIFRSLPRAGQNNAAQILAEWGDCREAFDSPEAVGAISGITPVTKASGKHKAVHFRWACNKRFRVAITTFADNSRRASPWADDIYQRARARGHDHPHAVRILARAWIRVIYRCWQDGIPYDPANHGAISRNETLAAA